MFLYICYRFDMVLKGRMIFHCFALTSRGGCSCHTPSFMHQWMSESSTPVKVASFPAFIRSTVKTFSLFTPVSVVCCFESLSLKPGAEREPEAAGAMFDLPAAAPPRPIKCELHEKRNEIRRPDERVVTVAARPHHSRSTFPSLHFWVAFSRGT